MRKRLSHVLASLVLLSVPTLGQAAMPVVEVGQNLVVNTVTATEAVAQTLNMLIELTPLEDAGMDAAFQADLTTLQALAGEAEGLGWSLQSFQSAFWELDASINATTDSDSLRRLQFRINRLTNQSYLYAMRTQTLISTALHTVEHLTAILGQVSSAIGNLTVSQSLGKALTKLQQIQAEAQVTRTAFERAQSLDRISPSVIMNSLDMLNQQLMRNHPRW